MAAYDENSVLRRGREEAKRGRGRPRREDSRRTIRSVRFDDEEETMLEHLEIEFDMSITDILRKAVRFYYYHMLKKL